MILLNFCPKLLVVAGAIFLTGCYYYQTPVPQYPDYSYYYPQPVQSAPQVSETTLQQQNFVHNHMDETTVNNAYTYNNAEQYNPYYYNPYYAYYGYDPYAYYDPYASSQVAASAPPQQKPRKASVKPSKSGASRVVQAKAAEGGAKPAKPEKPQSTLQAAGRQSPKPSSPARSAGASDVTDASKSVEAVEEPTSPLPQPEAADATEELGEEEWEVKQEDELEQSAALEPGASGAGASSLPGSAVPVAASGTVGGVVGSGIGSAVGTAVTVDVEPMPAPTAARGLVSGTVVVDAEPLPRPAMPAAAGGIVDSAADALAVVDAEPLPGPAAPTAARGLVSGTVAVASAQVTVSPSEIRPVYEALRNGDQAAFEAAAGRAAASLKERGFNQTQLETPFSPAVFKGLGATPAEESQIIAEITKHL